MPLFCLYRRFSAALFFGLLGSTMVLAQEAAPLPPLVDAAAEKCPADPPGDKLLDFWRRCWPMGRQSVPGDGGNGSILELGARVNEHALVQINNGARARMVLYQYDFIEGTSKLNQRGTDQLAKIVQLLDRVPGPIVIERTTRDPLDQGRRLEVFNTMQRIGVGVDIRAIVIGVPRAIPLHGAEAELLYRNLLTQTQSGGAQKAGATGGASGGFSR